VPPTHETLSPLSVKPTTDGVSREPEELIKTFGDEPSITATTEFVVPKSIPIILAIVKFLSLLHGIDVGIYAKAHLLSYI
jgi:hypothetical protein